MTINSAHGFRKPRRIANLRAILILARVETECLFVYISEKVKRLDGDVSTMQLPLKQRPEVFNSVRVNGPIHIVLKMVDDLMNVICVNSQHYPLVKEQEGWLMPENTKPTPQELPTTRTDKFVRIYANAANLEVTPWDFKIIFGELKKAPDGKPAIEQSVEVTMSPQHAKALADILSTNVREYEKNVGEIKLPRTPDAAASPPMPVSAVSQA